MTLRASTAARRASNETQDSHPRRRSVPRLVCLKTTIQGRSPGVQPSESLNESRVPHLCRQKVCHLTCSIRNRTINLCPGYAFCTGITIRSPSKTRPLQPKPPCTSTLHSKVSGSGRFFVISSRGAGGESRRRRTKYDDNRGANETTTHDRQGDDRTNETATQHAIELSTDNDMTKDQKRSIKI